MMMVVEKEKEIVGYFFIRCMLNKKAVTGRLVDSRYQGQGIAKSMAKIMHAGIWNAGFRGFATISTQNYASLSANKAVSDVKIIKELDNGFLLVEFLKKG
jgi:hypothetical protein